MFAVFSFGRILKGMKSLLDHPFWQASDSDLMRLVRVFEIPSEVNPFVEDDVIIKIASTGEIPYHKWPMAREGILDGIQRDFISPDTVVVEATSGNTGHAMASICNILGLKFVAVVASDVPGSKIDIMRAFGGNISIRTPESGETTVDCARRLGAQKGWYNPDQYSGEWNPRSHREHLAPQLFNQTQVSIFVTPGGTMGTSLGISQYARANNLRTKVVPVMCAEGQEIPAARTLSRVNRDIRFVWQDHFDEKKDIQFGTRYASFLLSYLSWRMIPVQLGPSFGLSFVGALKFLREHKASGTLDQFREPDGKIHLVVFGPDDYRPYNGLYLAERLYEKDFSKENLLDLIDLV